MPFDTKTDTVSLDALVGGPFPRVSRGETILTGQVLSRGAVLGKITASGKLQLLDTAAVDGSENPYAILADSVDTTDGDKVGPVFLTGEFNKNALSVGGTTTIDEITAALRALSIFVKDSLSLQP